MWSALGRGTYRAGVRVTLEATVAAAIRTLSGRVRVAEVAITAALGFPVKIRSNSIIKP